MNTEFNNDEMHRILAEAEAMRSREVARLIGLLFRRRPARNLSNAVNG